MSWWGPPELGCNKEERTGDSLSSGKGHIHVYNCCGPGSRPGPRAVRWVVVALLSSHRAPSCGLGAAME